MMRESCGANDHPDSSLFIQLYRLVSTYSLIQPMKGSNVSNTEVFEILLKIQDIKEESIRKDQLEAQLDTILDSGSNINGLIEAASLLQEHDYSESEASQYVNTYIAGYVARKASCRFSTFTVDKKRVPCNECKKTLVLSKKDVIRERHKLIKLRTKGYLKYPSLNLCDMIDVL